MRNLTATGSAAWPDVDVIVRSNGQRHSVQLSIASIVEQDYPADVRIIVVAAGNLDHPMTLDHRSPTGFRRVVEVCANTRSPGGAGSLNCGIDLATAPLIAVCDAGDEWLVQKLRRQVAVLRSDPAATFVTMGARVRCRGHQHDHIVRAAQLDLRALLRGHLTRLHPSTFVMSREAIQTGVGLLDENCQGSRVADLEFLARAARWAPIRNLPEVGVEVARREPAAADSSKVIASDLSWLLDRCPEFVGAPSGHARVSGQLAMAAAADGDRRAALHWAGHTLVRNVGEPRAYLALAVASGVLGAPKAAGLLGRRRHRGLGLLATPN